MYYVLNIHINIHILYILYLLTIGKLKLLFFTKNIWCYSHMVYLYSKVPNDWMVQYFFINILKIKIIIDIKTVNPDKIV